MEFLKNIDKETIIICNHSMKRKILQYQSEQDEILPIHFFTLDEFMKKYFFDLSFEAYLYVMNTYHVKYDVASMYLKNSSPLLGNILNLLHKAIFISLFFISVKYPSVFLCISIFM